MARKTRTSKRKGGAQRRRNVNRGASAPTRRSAVRSKALQPRMSQAGVGFLKCAFAPPDFNTDPGMGIPDSFEGKVLCRKDVVTATVNFPGGVDTFLLVAPTPGLAYWSATVPSGTFPTSTTVFTPLPFPGFPTMFGTATDVRSSQVSQFRYASMNAGLYPTSNQMSFAGSTTIWKVPVKLGSNNQLLLTSPNISEYIPALQGLDGVLAVSPDNFAHSFIDGAFSQATNNEPDFNFSPILEGLQSLPPAPVTLAQSGQPFTLDAGLSNVAGIVGWGDMDTIVIRVSTPAGGVNSAIFKVWACLEYRPNPNSALYQFGHDSPALDPVALGQYRNIAKNIPVAVVAAENASMWERVKSIIKSSLSFASMVPGPIGVAATGLQGLGSLFSGLGL